MSTISEMSLDVKCFFFGGYDILTYCVTLLQFVFFFFVGLFPAWQLKGTTSGGK